MAYWFIFQSTVLSAWGWLHRPQNHVTAEASKTFRPPKGVLRYPYLVPAGPYEEMWDWDSMFMGVALSNYGAIPYFTGTFMNFLVRAQLALLDIQRVRQGVSPFLKRSTCYTGPHQRHQRRSGRHAYSYFF